MTPTPPTVYTAPLLDTDGTPIGTLSFESGMYPACGTVTIGVLRGKKLQTHRYLVTEIQADWRGRDLRVFKPVDDPGTDPEADDYSVRLDSDPRMDACDCRGFLRWGRPCKHLLALRHLTAAGKL